MTNDDVRRRHRILRSGHTPRFALRTGNGAGRRRRAGYRAILLPLPPTDSSPCGRAGGRRRLRLSALLYARRLDVDFASIHIAGRRLQLLKHTHRQGSSHLLGGAGLPACRNSTMPGPACLQAPTTSHLSSPPFLEDGSRRACWILSISFWTSRAIEPLGDIGPAWHGLNMQAAFVTLRCADAPTARQR